MANKGTITTNYYDSGDRDLGRYRLEWYISGTSGLTSTISYTIYIDLTKKLLRPYSCFIDLSGYNGGTVSTSNITVLPEGSYSGGESTYPDDGDAIGSGTFTVTHNSSAKGGFSLRLYGGIYSWSSTAVDSGYSSSSLPDLYSNCTPPSIVSSPSASVITPGSLVVNWSGATDGTNNAIKNYTVYWLVSSTSGQLPTTSWYSGKETTSNLSYSIAIPESYRGQYISVRVQSNAAYNSPISSDYISRSVNSLPNSPLASFTSKTIPSTQTSITITGISPGNLNFGSKTGSVHWASSSDGPKALVSGGEIKDNALGDLAQGGSKYYYFWTYDGLEYSSSPTIVTITKNIKPAIAVDITSFKNSIVRTKKSEIPDVLETIGFTVTAKNKACYYTLKILRGTGADERTLYTLKSDSYLSGKEETDTPSFNIRSLGLSAGDFYFHFACNDYIESGDSIIKDNNKKNYYSPALPTFSNDTTYNQFSESPLTGTNSTDFYQQLRFVSSHYDSYLYDNGTFRLDTGSNETISYTVNKSVNLEKSPIKIFYDVTITSDLTPSQNYDFFPTLQIAGLTSSALVSRRRTPVLDPTPSSGSPLYIKPFTDGWDRIKNEPTLSSKKISISKGAFVGGTLDDSFYNYYNIDQNSEDWWESVIITPNGEELVVTDLIKEGTISGDYYERKFEITGSRDSQTSNPKSDFFDKLSDDFSKTGTLTCALKNTIKNRFGQTISKQSSIVTLDFNEEPILGELRGAPTTGEYLIEGGRMSFGIPVYTFSTNDLSISFLIDRQDGKGFVTYREDAVIWYGGVKIPFGTGRYTGGGISIPIKEITGSSDCFFALRIFDGQKEIDTKGWTVRCKRIKMSPPILSFTKTDYEAGPKNEDGSTTANITCYYTTTDPGYDFSQIIETEPAKITVSSELTLVLPRGDEYPTEKNLSKDTGTYTYKISPSIDNFQNAKLVLKNTLTYTFSETKKITLTKSSTSNDLIIYGITPTVAYRQNHLGINTSTLQNDSVLTIAPTSGRNTIYLQKVGSTDTFKINLTTGALEGFIFNIDCGEIKPET